ncbi:hypothetical protein [Streptomyces sp. NPDC048192]|uniref:hypothetical protein n=1 Tax=Streptomyces sp. NPDC048192 TaxID=3365510 RepID=UPI00371AB397
MRYGSIINRAFETGWSDDYGSLDHGTWTDLGVSAGGAGAPAWSTRSPPTRRVVPASMPRVRVGKRIATNRAVPGLAADGAPDTGLLTGYTESGDDGRPGPYWTTSLVCAQVTAGQG